MESWRQAQQFLAGNAKKYTIAAAAVLVLVSAVYAPSMANDPGKTGDYITADLVTYIQDLNPQRLYTSYNDGGYCIYHGIKSFADSRADLFPDDVIEASVNFAFMSYSIDTGMEDCMNQFNFDAILLRALPKRSLHRISKPAFRVDARI